MSEITKAEIRRIIKKYNRSRLPKKLTNKPIFKKSERATLLLKGTL